VRFAVGTPGKRSSVWRLWNHGDEVYVGVRDIAGHHKASLHRSGDWHEAFSREHTEGPRSLVPPGRDRVLEKWRRPREFAPGLPRGEAVWVIANDVPATDELKAQVDELRRVLARSTAIAGQDLDPQDADIRVCVAGTDDEGTRKFLDLALRPRGER
jgi:hypothetical protein